MHLNKNMKFFKVITSLIKTTFTHPIGQKNIFKTFFRILRWQIVSRIKNNSIENWLNDLKVICQSGDTGFTGNLYFGLYDYDDMRFIIDFLDDKDTFLDVGSNVGAYSLISAGICKSKTYCFEPNSKNYSKLLKNLEINALTNVFPFNLAISEKKGFMRFSSNLGPENYLLSTTEDSDIEVDLLETRDLDSFTFISLPTFIKIDVEGHELSVLKGSNKILQCEELLGILVEINGNQSRYGFEEDSIENYLNKYNFLPYTYNPKEKNFFRIDNIIPKGNTLFIRDLQKVKEKIISKKTVKLWNMKL